ncbi:hypothetical protein [Streptomyces sp. NBC_01304]|uniref:hypothetical protein n=1 Tax=Streptomyces sp. NBC_01304 TaxID=2903818 RepID=UPI002E14B1F1|nr:hypothetical protein OG430_12845 [Streptomyces sp. NBC_01304]
MIRIGVTGRIVSGDRAGAYVRIEALRPEDPPSYLVHVAADRHFSVEGGDEWVEDLPSLRQYVAESGWAIAWE